MAGQAGQRHNAAFVVGSILGGVIGAAATLWKAPRTGEELRGKLMGGDGTTSTRVSSADPVIVRTSASSSSAQFSSKVLSFVERATAPIVGVKLGQTANGSGPATRNVNRSRAITDNEPASTGAIDDSAALSTSSGRLSAVQSSGASSATLDGSSVGQAEMAFSVTPSQASTSIPEGVPGHIPTTEELVTPVNPPVQETNPSDQTSDTEKLFPDYSDPKSS